MDRSFAKKRAERAVRLMTLPEKASQLLQKSPAIKRLGISEYDWWNEALHGVARADIATVFPQAIGLAATFDTSLLYLVGAATANEARVKYNENKKHNDFGIYKGLTFWSPNVNIFRDPRWGRGQETYGEDPFLSSALGSEFVTGIQGKVGGIHLKAAACAKHFAVHSGPESLRHSFDAVCSKQDLYETYLPAFEHLVKDAHVEGVMGAYNRTNGEVCCAHSELMDKILFEEWGFEGYYVSDCGAICDFHSGHHVTENGPQSAALAIKHGCNINCGNAYENILAAVEMGLITEEDVDRNVVRAYTTRFLLGEFDSDTEYDNIPFTVLDSPTHTDINQRAARESIVLLKNDGILPLKAEETDSIAVIGPNAMSISALTGNYHGTASEYVCVADGIRRACPKARLNYATGCRITGDSHDMFTAAVAAAEHSDVTVLCLGLDEKHEGEEMGFADAYFNHGDRFGLSLPAIQLELAEKVCEVSKKVIVVIMAGSSVDIGPLRNRVNAEILAWYPGAQGGAALADILFGNYSPSGKLPVTIYNKDEKLPDFSDYSMANRTYRFFEGKPVYPFGYGLSYSEFTHEVLKVTRVTRKSIELDVIITNTGTCAANVVTQVYARFTDAHIRTPKFQLCAIANTKLESGESVTKKLNISNYWLRAVDEDGKRVRPGGKLSLFVGTHQPDEVSNKLCGDECLEIRLK